MLRQLWRWLQNIWQQWFGRPASRSSRPTPSSIPLPLSDAEYENLFFGLLAGLERTPSRGWLQGWLISKRSVFSESDLLAWFERFADRLRAQPPTDPTLVDQLRILGQIGYGSLSAQAQQLFQYLHPTPLSRPPNTPCSHQAFLFFSPIPPPFFRSSPPSFSLSDFCPDYDTWDAELWFKKGAKAFEADDSDFAWFCFEQGIQLDPNLACLHNGLGNVYANLMQYERATVSFQTALQLDPNFAAPYYGLGIVYKNLGHYAQAIASFQQALQLDPNFVDPYYGLGVVHAKLDHYEQAIASFQQAIQINPYFAAPHYGLGMVYKNLGHYVQAIESFQQARSLQQASRFDSYFAAPYYGLGMVYQELGYYGHAIASFEQAIQINSDFSAPYNGLGTLYTKLGQYEEAIFSFDQGLRFDFINWQLWVHRSFAVAASRSLEEHPMVFPPEMQSDLLTQQGYAGAVGTLQTGLKYIPSGREGEGRLHHELGRVHYRQSQQNSSPSHPPIPLQRQAVREYCQALKIFQSLEAMEEAALEVLQDLIFSLQDLGKLRQADGLRQTASESLQRLLNKALGNPSRRQRLELKFARFRTMAISLLVQQGYKVEAWESAEQHKNSLLAGLLSVWGNEPPTTFYLEAQALLDQETALVYWHVSPLAITTFLLKLGEPQPIPIADPDPSEVSTAIAQSRRLDQWISDWNQQYTDYWEQEQASDRSGHPWRQQLPARLDELKALLNIPSVEAKLAGITRLILMPHQDLHRFPLHTLFADTYTCTYLPTVRVGLNLQAKVPLQHPFHDLSLLSVEKPKATEKTIGQKKCSLPLPFAEVESELISQPFSHCTRHQSDKATETAVLTALQQPHGVFHFTGHSFYDCDRPSQSTLYLAGPGQLTLEKLMQLHLDHYYLVTLSACESTATVNQPITTEFVNLGSVFLRRGVSWVVSPLWTVESAAPTLLMVDFYERLTREESPPSAFKAAQKWLRESSRDDLEQWYQRQMVNLTTHPHIQSFFQSCLTELRTMDPYPYAHPYHWAAFTLAGKSAI